MGSQCSILNDTEYNVWITHGINWPFFNAAVNFLLALAAVSAGWRKYKCGEGNRSF